MSLPQGNRIVLLAQALTRRLTQRVRHSYHGVIGRGGLCGAAKVRSGVCLPEPQRLICHSARPGADIARYQSRGMTTPDIECGKSAVKTCKIGP